MTSNLYTEHAKACFAQALISAIENARDSAELDAIEFQRWSFSGQPFEWATGYLANGDQTCTCHVGAIKRVKEVYRLEGVVAATNLASMLLQDHVLQIPDYIALVQWSEGRGPLIDVEDVDL